MVAVLVERMLPVSLSDDPDQDQVSRVHVGVSVVGLVRVVGCVGRVHVVRHGAPIDEEVRRMVRLGLDIECGGTDTGGRTVCDGLYLVFCLLVDVRIQLHPLGEVFAVVAGLRVVIGGGCEPKVGRSTAQLLRNGYAG